MITADPTINGTVTNDGSVDFLKVEVDTDGDGEADDFVYTDSSGNFTFNNFSNLAYGSHTIQFRPIEYEPGANVGDWAAITFTWQNDPAVMGQLTLDNDTGTSNTDMVTTDGMISGVLTNDGDVAFIQIEIDYDGDGIADDYTWTDANGAFSYDTTPYISTGDVTIQVRPVEIDQFTYQNVYGDWETISFTLE